MVHELVTSKKFDVAIVIVILLNVLSMGLEHEGMTITWVVLITNFGYVFTVIYVIEMALKLIAFG